jgi:hypothetical protein
MYTLLDEQGRRIDASFEIEDNCIIFHSRSGAKDSDSARNTDYGEGLRLIFRRLDGSNYPINRIYVDSKQVQNLSLEDRTVYSSIDANLFVDEMFTQVTTRVARVGQAPNVRGGNQTKRLRLELDGKVSIEKLIKLVRGIKIKTLKRLPATGQNKVNAQHIWQAIEKIKDEPNNNNFGPATRYEVVLDDGTRLAPKVVFGEALKLALNKDIGPDDFSADIDSICIKEIRSAGFNIVSKGTAATSSTLPVPPEDKSWAEGSKKRISHLKRERQSGLANAKKAAFIAIHGKLYCERCNLDPVEMFGKFGAACIEVHHIVPLSEAEGHSNTRLDDLECLCANCHRVVHKELREQN